MYPSIRQLSPAPVSVQSAEQTFDKKNQSIPLPNQPKYPSTGNFNFTLNPFLILIQIRVKLDETLRKAAQTFNQTLLMTIKGTPNSNSSNSDTHNKILDRQPAPTLATNDTQGQSLPPQKDCYDTDLVDPRTDPIMKFKKTKQVITGIDTLSHIPEIHNKILHELNHNCLCQYNNSCKHIREIQLLANCSQVLIFLEHPCTMSLHHTPTKGYKINVKEIL